MEGQHLFPHREQTKCVYVLSVKELIVLEEQRRRPGMGGMVVVGGQQGERTGNLSLWTLM